MLVLVLISTYSFVQTVSKIHGIYRYTTQGHQIYRLPSYTPPPQRKKPDKAWSYLGNIVETIGADKWWIQTSLLYFPCYLQEGTDIELYIQQVDRKLRPQPFILLIGDSRKKPLQIFVIVERHGILFPTVTKAVDYAFKVHYVLDVEYQTQCYAAWQFLQTVIYKMPGEALSNSVREIRTYLNSNVED